MVLMPRAKTNSPTLGAIGVGAAVGEFVGVSVTVGRAMARFCMGTVTAICCPFVSTAFNPI